MLADFIDNQLIDSAFKMLIFTPSSLTDALPYYERAVSLDCLKSVGELFDAHPDMNIKQLWLPRNIPTVGFSWLSKPSGSLASGTPRSHSRTRKQRQPKQPQSQHGLSVRHVPPWHTKSHSPNRLTGDRTSCSTSGKPAKFSCLILYTMYWIITGHAFLGSYTQVSSPRRSKGRVVQLPLSSLMRSKCEHLHYHHATHPIVSGAGSFLYTQLTVLQSTIGRLYLHVACLKFRSHFLLLSLL